MITTPHHHGAFGLTQVVFLFVLVVCFGHLFGDSSSGGVDATVYNMVTGWYQSRKSFYFDFGGRSAVRPDGGAIAIPIYVFIYGFDSSDNPIAVPDQHNVVSKIPDVLGYSDLWLVNFVMVPSTYVANTVKDEATILSLYEKNITVPGKMVNCPVVDEGSVLVDVDGSIYPLNITIGWYNDQLIYYFDFGEDPSGPIPIYVFYDEFGNHRGSNVIATTLGDPGYSAFWAVEIVGVLWDYKDNTIRDAINITGPTAPYPPPYSAGFTFNCPVVRNDPPGSLYLTTGWYSGLMTYYWDFGPRSATSGNTVSSIPIYVFITGFDPLGNPLFVPGSHNVIGLIPGDPGYSDLWNIVFVTVPTNYVANTIKSENAIFSSNYNTTMTSKLVNCPIVEYAEAVLWDGNVISQNTTQGWYNGNAVYYFNFGETSPNAIGIEVFTRADGTIAGNNVIQYDRSDPYYSDFWAVQEVMVSDFYAADTIRDFTSPLTPFKAVLAGKIVNCPVLKTDRFPTIYPTLGWYKNVRSVYYNFGPDSLTPNSLYRFITGYNATGPAFVPGQYDIFSVNNNGSASYSAWCNVYYVTVGSSYVANTVRDEATVKSSYNYIQAGYHVNRPIVLNGTVLNDGGYPEADPFIPILQQGWYNDQPIYYFDFSNDTGIPIPIYVFKIDDTVGNAGDNVIDYIPSDPGYSAFWSVNLIQVNSRYLINTIQSVATLETFDYPYTLPGVVVNCPVVYTFPVPPAAIYYTLGWYKNRRSLYYDFGNRSAVTNGVVDSIPIYVFVTDIVNGQPVKVVGQHNVVSRIPGDPLYSDLWVVKYVTVGLDYVPDSVRDQATILSQYAHNITNTSLLVNCPIVGANDTVLGNGLLGGNPNLIQGWFNDNMIYYFDFGPILSPYPIPIYVMLDAAGNHIIHNIIDSIPGDQGYSPFWAVNIVTVDSSYTTDLFTGYDNISASSFAVTQISKVVNCPVVFTYATTGGSIPPTPPTAPPTTSPVDPDLLALGFTNFVDVVTSPDVRVFWKPVQSSSVNIEMAVRGYGIPGFVAVGFPTPTGDVNAGTAMIGSDAVIGWIDSSNTANVQAYSLNGKSTAQVVISTKLAITATSGMYQNGDTTIFFTRPLNAGANPLSASMNNRLIGSYSSTGGVHIHDSHSTAVTLVNFETGVSTLAPPSTAINLRDVHGVIMMLSWGFMILFGAMFARYAKKLDNAMWFKVHQVVQPLGYVVALAGFIIAFIMVDGDHFNPSTRAHGVLGVIIMGLGFFQILGGIFRPHKHETGEQTTARKLFEVLHPWNGRLLCVLVIAQLYLGFLYRGWPQWGVFIGYGIYLGIALIFIIVAEATHIFTKDPVDYKYQSGKM